MLNEEDCPTKNLILLTFDLYVDKLKASSIQILQIPVNVESRG